LVDGSIIFGIQQSFGFIIELWLPGAWFCFGGVTLFLARELHDDVLL